MLKQLYSRIRAIPLSKWRYPPSSLRWATVGAYMGLIAFLSLSPAEKVSSLTLPLPHFDKLAHAGMHGGLAFLICWALQYRFRHRLWLLYVILISHLYGTAMELGQYYMNLGRTFSWGDIAANTVGAIIAVTVLGAYQAWKTKKFPAGETANPFSTLIKNLLFMDLAKLWSPKRIFDFTAALAALLALSPLLIIIALLVRLKHGSPILFRQLRPGMNEQPFALLKFRTMTESRDEAGDLLPDDQRLTQFGRFLRTMSLDELPELINVLKGEMSLVGPRPLLIRYLQRYTPEQKRRHEVRPGITGWAQIHGRNAIDWEEKFNLDVWYVDNRSFWLDLKIIALTIWKVISRQDISADNHATMPEFMGSEKENSNQ